MFHPYLIESMATEHQRELRDRALSTQREARNRAAKASEPATRPPRVRPAVAALAAETGRWARRPSPASQAGNA